MPPCTLGDLPGTRCSRLRAKPNRGARRDRGRDFRAREAGFLFATPVCYGVVCRFAIILWSFSVLRCQLNASSAVQSSQKHRCSLFSQNIAHALGGVLGVLGNLQATRGLGLATDPTDSGRV